MNAVIIILLVWIIVFLHLVWLDIKPWEWLRDRRRQGRPEARAQEQTTGKDVNFIGKSLVQVKPKETNAASVTPKAPQAEEGEEVDEKDVTFVPPKQEKALRQMPPEEEEEAFKSFSYSKGELSYEDDYPASGYAEGLTCEEMERAVSVANGAKATKDEEQNAVRTLKDMEGTELIELLTSNNPAFKARVRNLLDRCERMKNETGTESTLATDKGRRSFKTENSTDIDIRNFI